MDAFGFAMCCLFLHQFIPPVFALVSDTDSCSVDIIAYTQCISVAYVPLLHLIKTNSTIADKPHSICVITQLIITVHSFYLVHSVCIPNLKGVFHTCAMTVASSSEFTTDVINVSIVTCVYLDMSSLVLVFVFR